MKAQWEKRVVALESRQRWQTDHRTAGERGRRVREWVDDVLALYPPVAPEPSPFGNLAAAANCHTELRQEFGRWAEEPHGPRGRIGRKLLALADRLAATEAVAPDNSNYRTQN